MTEIAAEVLNELANECHAIAVEKGWYDRQFPLTETIIMSVSELSECMEADRAGNPVSAKIPPHHQVAEELADAVIRIVGECHARGIDIGAAVMAKVAYNRTRAHKHGGKAY